GQFKDMIADSGNGFTRSIKGAMRNLIQNSTVFFMPDADPDRYRTFTEQGSQIIIIQISQIIDCATPSYNHNQIRGSVIGLSPLFERLCQTVHNTLRGGISLKSRTVIDKLTHLRTL